MLPHKHTVQWVSMVTLEQEVYYWQDQQVKKTKTTLVWLVLNTYTTYLVPYSSNIITLIIYWPLLSYWPPTTAADVIEFTIRYTYLLSLVALSTRTH